MSIAPSPSLSAQTVRVKSPALAGVKLSDPEQAVVEAVIAVALVATAVAPSVKVGPVADASPPRAVG